MSISRLADEARVSRQFIGAVERGMRPTRASAPAIQNILHTLSRWLDEENEDSVLKGANDPHHSPTDGESL